MLSTQTRLCSVTSLHRVEAVKRQSADSKARAAPGKVPNAEHPYSVTSNQAASLDWTVLQTAITKP